jgi:hypothetical protein
MHLRKIVHLLAVSLSVRDPKRVRLTGKAAGLVIAHQFRA